MICCVHKHAGAGCIISATAISQMWQDGVVVALVRGLQSCPDVVAWRKEVLVATRHVMNVMLRTGTHAAMHSGTFA